MKKLLLYTGLALFFLSSCKNYLDEDVKSYVTTDEYYRTKTGYVGLVSSAYSSLRDIYSGDPYIFCAGTDMYIHGRTVQPLGLSEYKELIPTEASGATYIQDFYYSCFTSIMIANCGIYYNSLAQDISSSDLGVYEGELRFIRAFNYFILVQQFGGVPIVEQYSQEPSLSYDRNSAEEVYAFIISEMKAAESMVDSQAAGALPSGRVNSRVIRHFLAKVYLTRGYESFADANDFSMAASYADAAIDGQQLTISFEDLFYPGEEKNTEVLFAIQYDASSIADPLTGGNRQNAFFGPYLGGEGSTLGYPARTYALNPTLYTYDLFTQDDSRWEASFMVYAYGEFNSAGKYTGRYYDYYDQASDRENLSIAYYYSPSWVSDDSIALWRAADPTNRSKTIVYQYGSDWEPDYSSADFRVPIVKKFDDPTSEFSSSGSSTRDIYLARLGETYLIAAEAYFKMGDAATSADRINEVRKRAARSGKDLSITSSDVSLDFILDERGRELLGEYYRWFDLKRTGTLKERTQKYNRDIKAYFTSGIDPFAGSNGIDKILRPIPQATIDANRSGNFSQNPAYE
jgi:starch-binding outer membrane protein, SusD/RagB family